MADDPNGAKGNGLAKLAGLGQIAIGLGFLLRGFVNVQGASSGLFGSLGRGQRDPNQLPASSAVTRARVEKVGDIADRVKRIKQIIVKDSIDPRVRAEVSDILTKKCGERWCVEEKNSIAELSAFFWALRDPRSPYALRYTKDHVFVDQFSHAAVMRKLKMEDCDGGTARLGAWLQATGYPVKLRVVASRGATTWEHIYIVAGIPANAPTRWFSLDWSVLTFRPGDEARGAAESIATGRPAGMIERARDFPLSPEDYRGIAGTTHSK
jgi:hypothetical protein